jgi:cytochrome c2
MTETFIEKAKAVHGDKYDYSKVEYINSLKEVIIICREHGEFEQLPKTHKRGSGCVKCGRDKTSNARKNTLEDFIEKATQVHGAKYDYSKVLYTRGTEKVIITCKEHGEYLQCPNKHLYGQGCIKCAGVIKKTNDTFIKQAKSIHGDKYDYSITEYKTAKILINITCKKGHVFTTMPNTHLHGGGCVKCSGKGGYTHTLDQFIGYAIDVHGDKYNYSKVNYLGSDVKVLICCKYGHEFLQKPHKHLQGDGCSMCSGVKKKTTESFIKESIIIHGDKYDYTKIFYKNVFTKVIIICKKCGEFEQTPSQHLQGRGCSTCCNSKGYSLKSIQWLNTISLFHKVNIQHKLNGGEFIIPTTQKRADGYCKETNTIYEFHGDIWHGNPNKFKPDKVSFFGTTYGELYQKTLAKEERIKELGYHLVVMWEGDWNRINHSISILQRKIRK